MKQRVITTVLLWVILLVGVFVLLYPVIANYWNSLISSRVVQSYTAAVAQMSAQESADQFARADAYNRSLLNRIDRYTMTAEQQQEYDSILDIGGGGVMGVLTIPKIGVQLPIYHGTGVAVLQSGVGHLPGSSLPVGGPSTHAVLSGHRGLPSAELLTNIDKLVVGDLFAVTVLGRRLDYQVDKISVVDPEDMRQLAILDGQDLVTLVTCTPYGVNTQRLLVEGQRVYTNTADLDVNTAGAVSTTALVTWLIVGLAVVGGLVYLTLRVARRKKKGEV